MENILNKIIANKQLEIAQQKGLISLNELANRITDTSNKYSFRGALLNSSTGVIAEFKRRSPSRDWIFKDAKIADIVPQYASNGAVAISILTDFDFFGGSSDDLEKARELVETPLLRKDFIVDEYQLYQAKWWGANAILLIASALTIAETKQLAAKAKELGLDVLLEIHNESELAHINEYVDVVGVNNRNLATFETDVQVSFDLVEKIPDEFVKISESGISSFRTVLNLQEVGYKGFLMGENFMKTSNPGRTLQLFINELIYNG